MKLTILCVFVTLLPFVSPLKYLFDSALISYKRIQAKKVSNRTFTRVISIDQHLFADAFDIKIRTKEMRMTEGAVKNIPHLRVLRLKDCGIKRLPQRTFRNLPSLDVVHLQENDLTVIENGVFNHLTIRVLWLHKNEIMMIQSSAFDDMPNLETIKLNQNMLSKWDSRWFANTPKLRQLYFKRNQITELPPKAFINIKSSHKIKGEELVDTQIFLCHNQIFEIHPEALHGIDSLDVLSLKKNELKEIDWKVFRHMTELHTLNLKKNMLSEIDEDAFENMSEILELDISKNSFECIPFEIVSKVKKVDVSGNDDMQCQCVFNLKERLKEERLSNEIVAENLDCAID